MPMPPSTVSRGNSGRITGTQGLTAAQDAFVAEYVANGAKGTAAAKAAGYADPGQEAWRLLQLPHVQEAIRFEQARIIRGELGTLAVAVLKSILKNPSTDKDMMALKGRVAIAVVDRAGHVAPKAPEAAKPTGDKPITEMSVAELDEVIAKGQALLDARLKNVTPTTIEGEAVFSDGPTPEARISDLPPSG